MSSATFVGTANPTSSTGFCSIPPPPPPPPVAGQVPAMRINTVEPSLPRRSQVYNSDSYEPPAAIQNAMMTKDKKPFTYTPGMGGKLDLSQIRSPRMARRVAKNANDEGIEGPPKSPLAAEQLRPVSTGANLFVQPQVAVPVFPTNPSPLQVNRTPNVARAPSNVTRDIESEPPRPMVKIDQNPSSPLNSPDTPSTPTQVTLTKAPTPWMQKNKQQEELPEWAKRSPPNESSLYSSRDAPNNTQTIYIQQPSQQKIQTKPASNERIIPLRVEDRPSVFTAKNEQGHHQFKQSSPHHQQRWGQSIQQPQTPPTPRVISAPSTPTKSPQPNSPGTYIVPIVVENSNNTVYIQRNDFPGNSIQNQVNKNVQKTPIMNQQESGPVQSKSFRVLQKITDTDRDDIDTEQLRKLQLTEDDKILMNKFKEQVDGDTYLHQEEDPRYRGAAIPSRAFRYLQNMTDSNEVSTNTNAPRAVNNTMKRQNRNSRTFEETQMNLPPSEQQVPEPKKYTGSAIPSRSFRILQAMTSPEDMAKQEIGQADFTCQVSSSMMPLGNQQGVFIPHYSQPIYWAYYPIPYQYNQSNYHQLHQNNIDVPNITNSIAYCHYQDINTPSSSAITDHSVSPAHYSFYPGFISSNNQNLVQEQETNSNNSLDSPAWVGAVVQVSSQPATNSSQPEINSSQCSDFINKDNTYLMNILHEEDDCNKKINPDDIDRLTNDENIITESQVSSTDEPSDSSDFLNTGNPPNDDEIEVDAESTSSDDDSDSYLAYSTGLNSPKECRDKLQVPEIKDKQNITDCESYTEEEEPYISVKTNNHENNEFAEKSVNNVDTTVSISLPMKFKFSVSTDDEETTTVNIENQKIQSHEPKIHQISSETDHDDKNDVSVNLKINYDSDTCANFTLKKKPSIRSKSWCHEESSNNFWVSETVVRKQPSSFTNSNLRECIITEEVQENNHQELNEELDNEIKIIPEFEITVNDVQNVDEAISIDENKKNPNLLTVQSSRDETDDEDSGVTSDMSRLISEADTDSENTPSRKLNTYTRTQTHSRLFRLLTDDLTTPGDTETTTLQSKSEKRNQLNLPLRKSSRFSYESTKDSNNTLNYSSIQKPTWRKFYNSSNTQTESANNDEYYKTWKESKQSQNSVQSSKHNSISTDKKLTYWSYKTNILCPRVKSGKNVPKILEGRVSKPVVHPIPSYVRYDRC